jgi:glutamate racemase
LPYGDKTSEQIIGFSKKIIDYLILHHQPKLIIVACNTSFAVAGEVICAQYQKSLPLIDIINPFIEQTDFNHKKVGIIATEPTIKSRLFERKILSNWPYAQVFGKACPLLVPLIEDNLLESEKTNQIIKEYLSEILIHDIEYLVYGCTHYPYLQVLIEEILPKEIKIINPAYNLVNKIEDFLKLNNLHSKQNISSENFSIKCFNTGCNKIFTQKIKYYIDLQIESELIFL